MYLKSRNANMVGSVLVLRDQGSDGESNVPIAAIVGGTLGGVMLAILAVIGWKLWGRSIRRQAEADRKRKVCLSGILTVP
jgi:protein-S-isoprenylcysteine O-methyltransferase Ste14